jgi:hypothetical protein
VVELGCDLDRQNKTYQEKKIIKEKLHTETVALKHVVLAS